MNQELIAEMFADIRTGIASRDARIAELEAELAHRDRRISELEAENADLFALNAKMVQAINAQNEKLGEVTSTLMDHIARTIGTASITVVTP